MARAQEEQRKEIHALPGSWFEQMLSSDPNVRLRLKLLAALVGGQSTENVDVLSSSERLR